VKTTSASGETSSEISGRGPGKSVGLRCSDFHFLARKWTRPVTAYGGLLLIFLAHAHFASNLFSLHLNFN